MGWGMKIYSNGPGHMTNMAAMPMFGKNLKKRPKRPMTLDVGMQHRVLAYYHVCSNDDLGLTLTYFMARSKLVPYGFVWEKGKTVDFSEIILVYDIKVGRYSQLIRTWSFMTIKGQGLSLTFVQGHSFNISNFFSSKITRPIEAIFHI